MVVQKVIQASSTSGPLPPAEALEKYDKVMPGLASRIVVMAETEGKHRRDLELRSIDANIEAMHKTFAEARLGQISALAIGIVAILAGTYGAIHGAQVAGGVIGGGGVVGLVSVFIIGRSEKAKNQSPPQ